MQSTGSTKIGEKERRSINEEIQDLLVDKQVAEEVYDLWPQLFEKKIHEIQRVHLANQFKEKAGGNLEFLHTQEKKRFDNSLTLAKLTYYAAQAGIELSEFQFLSTRLTCMKALIHSVEVISYDIGQTNSPLQEFEFGLLCFLTVDDLWIKASMITSSPTNRMIRKQQIADEANRMLQESFGLDRAMTVREINAVYEAWIKPWTILAIKSKLQTDFN